MINYCIIFLNNILTFILQNNYYEFSIKIVFNVPPPKKINTILTVAQRHTNYKNKKLKILNIQKLYKLSNLCIYIVYTILHIAKNI